MKPYTLTVVCLSLVLLSLPVSATSSDKTNEKKESNTLSFFQKGRLNDPIMSIDFGANRAKLDQHIYQVREGSIGGYDAVGGSCGCN
jgi:hypothetical protein